MPKLPKKESQSQLLALYWGIGVTCVGVLLGVSFPEWGVGFLVVAGAVAFTLAFYMHGWFSAPLPMGRFVRVFLFLLIIWGGMALLGWSVWPTVEARPTEVSYSVSTFNGETHEFTITNNKSRDVFVIAVTIGFDNGKLDDYKIEIPKESLHELVEGQNVAGMRIADIMGLSCADGKVLYLTIFRLRPHDFRELTVKHLKSEPDHVTINITSFTTDETHKYQPSGRIVTPMRTGNKECREPQKLWSYLY